MNTESFALGSESISQIVDRGAYSNGHVITPHGIVLAFAGRRTSLRFAYRGLLHIRTWDRRYSPRYIVTLAGRMTREVCYER